MGAGGGDPAGHVRPPGLRGLGVADAQGGVTGVDDPPAPGLGVGHGQRADVGQVQLARVDHLDGDDVVAAGEGPQRVVPAVGHEEVGHHDDEAAAAGVPAQRGRARRRGRPLAPSSGGRRRRGEDGADVLAAAAGRERRLAAGGRQRADPVAAAGGQQREGAGGGPGHVVLLAAGGAEGQAGRVVDQQPQLQLVVGDGVADVGLVVRAVSAQSMRRVSSPGA